MLIFPFLHPFNIDTLCRQANPVHIKLTVKKRNRFDKWDRVQHKLIVHIEAVLIQFGTIFPKKGRFNGQIMHFKIQS